MNSMPDDREGFASFLLRMRARGISNRDLLAAIEATPRRSFVSAQWQNAVWSEGMIPIECGETLEGIDLQTRAIAALDPAAVHRVLLCSGKVYYDLAIAREQRDIAGVAIVRVEQLYPFPAAEIEAALAPFAAATEICWVQEEPWNMGAWHFIHQRLLPLVGTRPLHYVGRDEAASPATGSYKIHQAEQADIVDRALRKRHGR